MTESALNLTRAMGTPAGARLAAKLLTAWADVMEGVDDLEAAQLQAYSKLCAQCRATHDQAT